MESQVGILKNNQNRNTALKIVKYWTETECFNAELLKENLVLINIFRKQII